MGHVPKNIDVCAETVILTFRLFVIDLQQLVHEDMKANFSKNPKNWEATSTDKNIDHRRVPNLMKYFKRQGWNVGITDSAHQYLPTDIIAWSLGRGIIHIGIITTFKSENDTLKLFTHWSRTSY